MPEVVSVGLAGRLADAIEQADGAACVALLDGVPESERRELAPAIVARCKELDALRLDWDQEQDIRLGYWRQFEVAGLALYGTASLGEIKALKVNTVHDQRLYDILASRRPAWIESWMAWTLAENGLSWPVIRRLVRDGVAARPESDANYYLWMIPHQHKNVRETLDADPGLLDHEVWRLFEVEGRSEVSLAQNDKYFRKCAGNASAWDETLVTLSREGRLDRARLLAASLAALARDLPQFQAGWFSRFHDLMEPSIDERVRHLREYLHLLASPIPPTVSFTLKALLLIDKAGSLDAVRFLDAAAAALHTREKSAAEALLKLLSSVVKRDPKLGERAATLSMPLLENPAPEIQEKVLAFIERHSDPQRLPDRLAEASKLVAPSLRKKIAAAPPEQSAIARTALTPDDPRLRTIPEKWLRLAGIAADGSLGPLNLDAPEIPRWHDGNRLPLIATVEELVEVFLRVLENAESPDGFERVLDGVARLCAERPTGFERLVSPLLKRARQKIQKSVWYAPENLFAALALSWIDQAEWPIKASRDNAGTFLTHRVQAIAQRVREKVVQPLYSTPTHSGGWIDAAAIDVRANIRDITDEFDRTLGELRSGAIPAPAWLSGPLDELHLVRWTSTLAPTHRAEWFAAGAKVIGWNLDWWSALWHNRAYLDALFEPDVPLGDAGMRLLVLGLAAKESGEGAIATDALIAAITDGRVEARSLGQAFTCAAAQTKLVLPRIAKRLSQAAQASILHAVTIRDGLLEFPAAGTNKALRQLSADLAAQHGSADLTSERLHLRLDRAQRWSEAVVS